MRAARIGAVLALIAGPARAATLEVTVDGAEADGGPVLVALCQGSLSEAACRDGRDAPPAGGRQTFVFRGVAPGTYAVAAFQDRNGNGRLDRTGLGLPVEPYGFSGDAGRQGRPDFARAAFTLTEPGAAIRLRLARALPRR
ncbi:DUF2141 domain-containing protein [Methylobacterium sp. A54F]